MTLSRMSLGIFGISKVHFTKLVVPKVKFKKFATTTINIFHSYSPAAYMYAAT